MHIPMVPIRSHLQEKNGWTVIYSSKTEYNVK